MSSALTDPGADPGGLRARLVADRESVLEIARKNGASNVYVFGSVARGDHAARSDIDLLVDLTAGTTMLDLARMRRELTDLLGTQVDVVSRRALLPRDRDVIEDALPL